jgi:hypothetical protein
MRLLRRARTVLQSTSLSQAIETVRMNFDEPRARCKITATTPVAGTRRIRAQVVDRIGSDWKGLWTIHLWLTVPGSDAPGGTQTAALVSGTCLHTYEPHRRWEFLTTPDGFVDVDVTIAGSATRFVRTMVVGEPEQGPSGGVVW